KTDSRFPTESKHPATAIAPIAAEIDLDDRHPGSKSWSLFSSLRGFLDKNLEIRSPLCYVMKCVRV
ncbi:MAG TPA: hypothetical protein P5281_01590, partial [Anaerovoracaceae bacterium]|nr:hypothetical protein [Anaerovoracaceae bacterium]